MSNFSRRIKRAAESILENEMLTADLDDTAAQALLDWGVACAEMIALTTADFALAEEDYAMHQRLRATRRLMRRANQWAVSRRTLDAEASAELLDQIVEQAAIIHGQGYAPPSRDQLNAFLTLSCEHADDPRLMIVQLRALMESPAKTDTAGAGGEDDQEIVD